MVLVDIGAIDCHACATSTHKWLLGPKGTGLLYVREDALDLISPTCVGAFSCADTVDPRAANFAFVPSAQRYEYRTLSGALIAGLGAAFTFLDDIVSTQYTATACNSSTPTSSPPAPPTAP